MKFRDYIDSPFEIFWGACVQFPIILIVKWWAIPVMAICGILWRLGGVDGGNKFFRRLGVPLVLCLAAFLKFHQFGIFLAIPFMIWACPFSYGDKSWLFIKLREFTQNQEKADLITRLILFVWYWAMFCLALFLPF